MLIANMVARNEEHRYLKEVLTHLNEAVDRIVFTDDASTDNTADLALSMGCNVFCNEKSLFEKDESQLRTVAWANLSQFAMPGDWILCIDADEMLFADRPDFRIGKLLSQQQYDVLNVTFYHMWNETHYRVDKAWNPTRSYRLFRYYLGGKFKPKKLACGSEPMYVETLINRGKYMFDTGLMMKHLGYMKDEDKQLKYDRYMKLDQGSYHSLTHLESILDPDPVLEPWNG